MDLGSIAMEKGLLYETIVKTVNDDQTPNAAPIGIICKNKNEVAAYLHHGFKTVRNIKRNHRFIVNILKDLMVFVESTLGNLSDNYFEQYMNSFHIKDSCQLSEGLPSRRSRIFGRT